MGKQRDSCLSLQYREPCQPILHAHNQYRCNDAYILGRIIEQNNETVCFDGQIELSGLPAHFCTPLTLCQVHVENIRPLKTCDCTSRMQLQIDLSCHVMDHCGRRARGSSMIEIGVCAPQKPLCGMSILRGAQIGIVCASHLMPCAFRVKLDVHITTMIARCAMMNRPLDCQPSCVNLPLYPQAIAARRNC